jgi:hypothetical protein
VSDDITFDHYVEENPNAANGPATTGETDAGTSEGGVPPKATTNEDGKRIKHNIYILTKKREAEMHQGEQDFYRKPVDLSNVSQILLCKYSN